MRRMSDFFQSAGNGRRPRVAFIRSSGHASHGSEINMSSRQLAVGVTGCRTQPKAVGGRGRRTSRGMTAAQEIVFFGVCFVVAVLLDLVVILKLTAVVE